MSDKQTENLYAFIDGELGAHETRFLLRALQHNETLRKKWERFHYSRSLLIESPVVDASTLATRVSNNLANEDVPEIQRKSHTRRWIKPVAGMSVAASVVFAAFAYLQFSQPVSTANGIANMGRAERSPQIIDESEPALSHSAVTVSSQSWDPKLQTYLMRHSQVSSRTQAKNLIPYIHVISTPVATDSDSVTEETEDTAESP